MNVEMSIVTTNKLDKQALIKIARVTNKVFDNTVIGGKGKRIATITQGEGNWNHEFTFDCENTEDYCDLLASELYTNLDFDFEVSIDCDIDEDYLEPCRDQDENTILIEDEPSVKHSKWVSTKMNSGWKFGMEHDIEAKTCPYLKPYHALSAKQKERLQEILNSEG